MNSLMLKISGACLVCAVVAAWLLWNAKMGLSVLVGGAIGLANLILWQRLVFGVVSQHQAGGLSGSGIAVRMVLKLLPLVVFLAVIFRAPLDPLGVMVGFGVPLFGLLWSGLCEGKGSQ